MIMFLIALVLAAGGVAAFAHYNPGSHDLNLRFYQLANVPDWYPVAAAAGGVLFLFLVHSIYTSMRISSLRRASERPGSPRVQRPLQSVNR